MNTLTLTEADASWLPGWIDQRSKRSQDIRNLCGKHSGPGIIISGLLKCRNGRICARRKRLKPHRARGTAASSVPAGGTEETISMHGKSCGQFTGD